MMHIGFGIWQTKQPGDAVSSSQANALHATATQQPQNRPKPVRRPWVGADERLIEKKLGDDPSIQQWCETSGGLVEHRSIKGAPGRYKVTSIAA